MRYLPPAFFLVLLLFSSLRAFSQTDGQPLFTFGVMTDVQYCDCDNAGTRHYRSSLRKLGEAVQTFNQEKVAFVTHLGDFIDRDFRSYDTLNTIVKPLNAPIRHVLGNHDFSVRQEEIARVPATLQLKARYYSFARASWRFIVLDGNDLSVYGNVTTSKAHKQATRTLESLKAQQAPNAQPWNGGLGDKQLKWLEGELKSAVRKSEKVVVFCHFPLVPANDQHNLWNHQAVKALLESVPNVRAYFNGHAHQSSYHTDKGIHYITFRGMVEQEENGFALVEVYNDHLKIDGYGAEPDRILK
ncbi:metallophosphoesterase [Larkinella insperata]|uniref:Metallophosphoesterase n=1 Tax=Larkinella insperata TaxID=332158 RepID=A0ABW3Q749_9BACT|nr:metallophosphoesterase [Larkinella insperata]